MEDNSNDILTQMIVGRLGERQRMLERMKEMERGSKVISMRKGMEMLAVAACIAICFMIVPRHSSEMSPLDELGISPHVALFRSGNADLTQVADLIDEGKYSEALQAVENTLHNSEQAINEFDLSAVGTGDEELDYEYQYECYVNSELRWTYACLLVRMERTDDALCELSTYLEHNEFCEHEEDAIALQKLLLKKTKK